MVAKRTSIELIAENISCKLFSGNDLKKYFTLRKDGKVTLMMSNCC